MSLNEHTSKRRSLAPYLLIGAIAIILVVIRLAQPHIYKRVLFIDNKTLFEKNSTVEIAGFQQNEGWQGNFTLDTQRSFDDNVGLNFFSTQAIPNTISLDKQLNLQNQDTIFVTVFVPDAATLKNIQEFALIFRNNEDGRLTSPITPLQTGWNTVSIPKTAFVKQGDIEWKSLSHISLMLTSKKNTTIQLSLDRLWAQNSNIPFPYTTSDKHALSVKTVEDKTYLHIASPQNATVMLNNMPVDTGFQYIVSVAPLKLGSLCLVFNREIQKNQSYLFCVKGSQGNEWSVIKQTGEKTVSVADGAFPNAAMEKEAITWLKLERNGRTLTLSYSFNGSGFQPLKRLDGIVTGGPGQLGIRVEGGAYLINTLEVLK